MSKEPDQFNPDSVEKKSTDFIKEPDGDFGKGNVPSKGKTEFDSVEKDDINLNPDDAGEKKTDQPDSLGQ